jgi:hypothetical protein
MALRKDGVSNVPCSQKTTALNFFAKKSARRTEIDSQISAVFGDSAYWVFFADHFATRSVVIDARLTNLNLPATSSAMKTEGVIEVCGDLRATSNLACLQWFTDRFASRSVEGEAQLTNY